MESTARASGTAPSLNAVVREHPHAAKLAALCLDVVRRQARGESLFSGRKFMRARAKEHGLTRAETLTRGGHVLDMLERGPSGEGQWSLISAFAVLGLEERCAELDVAGRDEALDEYVRLADWLLLATPYQPYVHVEEIAEPSLASSLWDAVERSVAGPAGAHGLPAHIARLEALVLAEDGPRRLAALSTAASHRVVASAAAELAGAPRKSTVRAAGVAEVEGIPVAPSGIGPLRVLGWLTGVAVLFWVVRLFAWSIGVRRVQRVSCEDGSIRIDATTALLGRVVRQSVETLPAEAVTSVIRELRRPVWVGVIGLLCLCAGLCGAAVATYTAIVLDETIWLAVGLASLGVGAGLDLVVDLWWSGRGASLWFELRSPRRAVRLAGVDAEMARRLDQAILNARD